MSQPNSIHRGYISPRWLCTKIDVAPNAETPVPPSVLMNDTDYRWRLVDLVFAYQYDFLERTNYTVNPFVTGLWARQLTIELGKTGQSDQNLVKGTISALCANQYRKRQKFPGNTEGWDCRLPSPYRLPRDAGLVVMYENTGVSKLTTEGKEQHVLPPLAFAAFGRDEITGRAVILAGEGYEDLNPGQQFTMNSADLFNRGRNEILIDRFVVKSPTAFYYNDGGTVKARDYTGTWASWSINPNVGEAWMPTAAGIPSACIAPLSRPVGSEDNGPRVYIFPPLTYLYPRQRLGVKFTNESGDPYTVYVCALVEMEVE